MTTARRWRVIGIYKHPGLPRRRIQTTVSARTAMGALTAHKRRVPKELRRYWVDVRAVLLVRSETEVKVEARRSREAEARAMKQLDEIARQLFQVPPPPPGLVDRILARTLPVKSPELAVVHRLEDIPAFTSEAEEAEFWGSHKLADELWDQADDALPGPSGQ